jgi:uncharacterized LabA/DUF88 family protein
MTRVQLFIDGFNLYHSIADKPRLRPYKWLDYWALGNLLKSRRQTLTGVFYFTAIYPKDRHKENRHRTFIRAQQLQGVTVIQGQFRRKDKYCGNCKASFPGLEEKESDVNMALSLLENAANDQYDVAFLLTGDGDLTPGIRAVRRVRPDKSVKVIFPPNRFADALKQEADSYMRLKEKHLAQCQLPNPLTKDGVTLHKPSDW